MGTDIKGEKLTTMKRLYILFLILLSLNSVMYIADAQNVDPDTTSPKVKISVPSNPQNGAFDVRIVFTEDVFGFDQRDVTLSVEPQATITAWSKTSDTTYVATITPTSSGNLEISIPKNVAVDMANNQNTASETETVVVDMDAPTTILSVPIGVQNSTFSVKIKCSERVIPHGVFSSIEVVTNTAGATIGSGYSMRTVNGRSVITRQITPVQSGEVVLRVRAGCYDRRCR